LNVHAPPKKAPDGLASNTGRKLTAKAEYHRTALAATSDRKRSVEPILANASIENAVLGSLINGGRALIDNLGVAAVEANLFYYSQSCKIFGAIAELFDEGAPIDLQIVTERVRKQGNLEAVGGAAFIRALGIDGNGDVDIARYNLGELRDLYAKRHAARLADRMKCGDIDLEDAREALTDIVNQLQTNHSWRGALAAGIVTSNELQGLQLTQRRKLLGDWFCEGDLGFIFAFRGVGKTWLALGIAQALSTGGKLGDWQAHERVRVLYIDGEMPPDLMRERCDGLQSANDQLQFLNHEILFERTGKVLNITNREIQDAIRERCLTTGVKVLILDNLSTLASGMKENEADSWELVNPWLLDLRRRKIAVVIVHHAGRSGEMRGTSKREDNVFWIIALDDAKKDADDKRGARFVSRFTKPSRNCQDEVPAFEWHFVTEHSGEVTISHKVAQSLDVFRQVIADGVTDNQQIAQEMKVSPATVSRFAKKAIDAGWLKKRGRNYQLIDIEEEAEK
jgi:AAA domain-containing protein/DnaB helicase-like protein